MHIFAHVRSKVVDAGLASWRGGVKSFCADGRRPCKSIEELKHLQEQLCLERQRHREFPRADGLDAARKACVRNYLRRRLARAVQLRWRSIMNVRRMQHDSLIFLFVRMAQRTHGEGTWTEAHESFPSASLVLRLREGPGVVPCFTCGKSSLEMLISLGLNTWSDSLLTLLGLVSRREVPWCSFRVFFDTGARRQPVPSCLPLIQQC